MTGRNRWISLLGLFTVAMLSMMLGACRSYPNCKTDAHCKNYDRGTPYCVDNICRACRDDDSCGEGQRCADGACFAIPGWCKDDAMCPSPGKCRGNACGPQCLGAADCSADQKCRSGLCVAADSCVSDSECGADQRCENNRCVARQNQQVALNANCEDGTFRTIYFDFDESTLTSAARADLEFNTKCFSARQGNATIQGHCDERGTEEYNLALGERRARAARKFLQDAGVSSSRMNVVSYGETRPADGRSSEDAWSRNRRAEFVWR